MEYSHITDVFLPLSVQFREMREGVRAALKSGHSMFHDNVLDISTMTISCTLQCGNLNMSTLQAAQEYNKIEAVERINAVTDKLFPNQVTFKVPRWDAGIRPIRRRKNRVAGCNVKVCTNGALNLTGCKNLEEACTAVYLVIQALGKSGAVVGSIRLKSAKLGMINIIVLTQRAIRLDSLLKTCDDCGLNTHFDA